MTWKYLPIKSRDPKFLAVTLVKLEQRQSLLDIYDPSTHYYTARHLTGWREIKPKPLCRNKCEGIEYIAWQSTVIGSNQGTLTKVTVVELVSSSTQTWGKKLEGFDIWSRQ